mmetsp:Transcript_2733/g.9621  ORF Transcript_2733/g.9621 Transcript_2733/m.9621 type:complete len:210 (+) Transcript_2733:63-692(+)
MSCAWSCALRARCRTKTRQASSTRVTVRPAKTTWLRTESGRESDASAASAASSNILPSVIAKNTHRRPPTLTVVCIDSSGCAACCVQRASTPAAPPASLVHRNVPAPHSMRAASLSCTAIGFHTNPSPARMLGPRKSPGGVASSTNVVVPARIGTEAPGEELSPSEWKSSAGSSRLNATPCAVERKSAASPLPSSASATLPSAPTAEAL